MGNNGQVLIDVIPQLELIIGKQPPITQVGTTEAQNRFNLVFQQFFRVICQKEHPLVLFIDDLQWADLPSLNLLETLMTDINNQYFLIIGAYRDNEVDATHPLMIMVKELIKAQTTVHTIQLQNLSSQDVNTLIADMLGCEPVYAHALTDLVYEKTQGNAFFTREFLKSLYVQELLVFDWQSQKWQWDVESIAAKQMTDNVVALMANKITLLSQETQNILRLAACIGNPFDLTTLSLVCQHSLTETLAFLWLALVEELVLPLDDNYKALEITENEPERVTTRFKFQHDRVQQAAYADRDDDQKKAVHLQIGRLLLAHTDNVEDHIFDIINQYNAGISFIDEEAEKFQLVELNLRGGKKAKAASAYKPAFEYLQTGIKLLENNAWQQHYALTLQLHIEMTEAAYLNGEFEQMEKGGAVVLQQAQTILEKVKVYEINIQALIAQNKLLDALKTALAILKQLGVSLPDKPTQSDIQLAFEETQSKLSHKKIDALYDLPVMSDPEKLAAMRILSSVATAALMVVPELYSLMISQMVWLSLENGNAKESTFGYVTYGFLLGKVLGDIEKKFQLGQVALELVERLNAEEHYSKTHEIFEAFVRHDKEHLRKTLKPALKAYQSGLETGDFVYGSYAAIVYGCHSYFVGKELTGLEQELVVYNHVFIQLNQNLARHWNEIFQQTVLNLMGESKGSPYRLIGEAYNEEKMLPIHQQANDGSGLSFFYSQKLYLCYLFGDYSQAIENADMTEKYLEALGGMILVPIFHFYDSLARLALYPDSSLPEQENILNRVTAHQAKMQKWSHHAPMNHLHKFYLVEAERCRVLGKDGEAWEFYEKAIELAQENEYLNEEALAYELAGRFYLAKGKSKVAQLYLRDAHYAYQRWGAMAKVQDLEDKYPQWFVQKVSMPIQRDATTLSSVTQLASTSHKTTSHWLDLNTLMKAAQTLSGEIVLSQLLEKMMHIVIENAGAEKGFLLLPKQDSWFIEAQGHTDSNEVNVLQSLSIENQPIAETIIHYVERSQKHVVLNHATQEGQFTRDPYIVKQRPKSVLCAPLVNQGQLTGIFYLENNLTTGAFTPERLEILNLLSSQIAISIENARFYTQLEEKVTQRTQTIEAQKQALATTLQQLQATQAQLVEAEKMASLGNLVAGVAHEINTPVGLGVTGASQLEIITNELTELFDSKRMKRSDLQKYLASANNISELILRNLNRAAGLVQSFKQVAVAQVSEQQRCFALKKTLNEVVFSLKPQLKDTHHQVVIDCDEELVLFSYPGVFSQIVTHFLMNSLIHGFKDSSEGQINITARLAADGEEGKSLIIRYSDNGKGMSEDVVENIFEPFFTTNRHGGGTGLGLHIVFNLVTHKLKGTIRCESTERQGTTFVIEIPNKESKL